MLHAAQTDVNYFSENSFPSKTMISLPLL